MTVWLGTSLRKTRIRRQALQQFTQSILDLAGPRNALLSVTIVGNTRMRSLNRRYRKKDYPTDVLAFPMANTQNFSTPLLGDVIICLPQALTQASRFGNTVNEEIARLLIHGTLHILGYDHERSSREASVMKKKELTIFKKLQPIPPLIST